MRIRKQSYKKETPLKEWAPSPAMYDSAYKIVTKNL